MAAPPPGSSCSCPITKTVTVNFTGSNPAPSNGYIVGYKKQGSLLGYTYVTPNPTSSPVNIPNVPVCEDLEIVMQSQCDNSQVSAAQTTTLTAYTSYVCGNTINTSHTHNGYYAYPDYLLNVQGATDTVTLTYDVIDLPNRFTVYDANGNLVVTSGWRGTAAFSGPWGASLSTATTGTISFSKGTGCFFRLLVESSTNSNTQDAFNVGISCPTTGDPVVPVITLQSCSNGSGSYRIDAPSGTNLKVKLTASGTLTNNSTSGYCARLSGNITSSTGATDFENSSIITTTGSASIGGSNSLFVDVTIPGVGYLVINTIVNTVNSAVADTTAAINIFEVNGTASNISQSVCVASTTGVVSCGSPTYTNYLATRYSCTACETASLENGVIVAFANSVSVVQGKFYVPDGGTGEVGTYVYLIGPQTNDGPGLIMQDLSATTCSAACQLSGPQE